jgi:hypothetical protein
MFLLLNGSIEGAMRNCRTGSFRAKLCTEKTAPSYFRMKPCRKSQTWGVRIGNVDMAAPDPFVFPFLVDQRDRLGVVHEHDVPGTVHILDVPPAGLPEDVKIVLRDGFRPAVQGVMEFLGHLEELVPAFDDPPVRGHPQFLEQRDHPVEDLGDPAADRRGVDVPHKLPLQLAGEQAQVVDRGIADDGDIIFEPGHQRASFRSMIWMTFFLRSSRA